VRKRRLTREEAQIQTREALIEAAAEVFTTKGFHAAALEEIAERAGYSRGAVYANFSGKDELFLKVFDRRLALAIQNGAMAIDAAAGRVDMTEQDPSEDRDWTMLVLEFWLYAMRTPEVRPELQRRYALARRTMGEAALRLLEDQGVQTRAGADELGALFIAFGQGMGIQRCLEPSAIDGNWYPPALARLLGIKGRPEPS